MSVKYGVKCAICTLAGADNFIEWDAAEGFFCANDHKFATLEEAQGTAQSETPVSDSLNVIDSILKEDALDRADLHAEAALAASADVFGGAVETSTAMTSVALPAGTYRRGEAFDLPDGAVSLAQAANLLERVLPGGDVMISVVLRADYLGHLREEAQTQNITLQEHVQRYLSTAVENSWL